MFGYFADHADAVLALLWTHTYLSVIPVVIGLVVALPLGWIASRYRWTYPPLITVAGLLYTIPSLVLFVLIPGIIGTKILAVVNIIIALSVYAVALLVRVVADGLGSVPPETDQAALAMGYRKVGQLFRVQLPLAVPVIAAGVRVATVSNVSLVAVATLVGTQQLGTLVDTGLAATVDRYPPIFVSIVLTVLLALVLDGVILLGTRLLTPMAEGDPMIGDLWTYLTTDKNWSGGSGLGANILDHLLYTAIAVGIALVIAVPLGLLIGHTGKGSVLVLGSANASRALPTFGLMVLLYIAISPLFTGRTQLAQIVPVTIVLLLLAIPPILSNTFAGIQAVDPAMRDAARGMGMTGRQVLFRVELPNAYPLMMSGIRSAVLQVVATATVGAYVGLGGLGRPIFAAIRQGPFQDTATGHTITGRLLAGAFLVAAMALLLDLILATIQRYTTSRGITRRYGRSHLPGPADVSVPEPETKDAPTPAMSDSR